MSLTDSAPISRMVRYQVPRLLVSPRRRAINIPLEDFRELSRARNAGGQKGANE